jgi:hypothetical protein
MIYLLVVSAIVPPWDALHEYDENGLPLNEQSVFMEMAEAADGELIFDSDAIADLDFDSG